MALKRWGPPRRIAAEAAASAADIPGQPYAKRAVRTSRPTRYWVLIRVPLREPGQRLRWPATLLIESASFRLGGLIFDSGPWLIAGLGGLALSILLWFPLVRGMTRSVSGMRRATGRIAEGQFDVRIAETRHDELGDLARSIDRMAEQLDWRTGASWIAPWGT